MNREETQGPGGPEGRGRPTPYGPHDDHIDAAAGGADSSPFEDTPSEEKHEVARDEPEKTGKPRPQVPPTGAEGQGGGKPGGGGSA